MSTIKLENKPNANGIRSKSKTEFITEYSNAISKHKAFKKYVTEFSEAMAKHPADVFIIPSFEAGKPCEQIRQGDIYLFRKGDESDGSLNNVMFDKYFHTISELKETNSMNLQLGDSITGDHKVVPLKDTNVTIQDCVIQLPIARWGSSTSSYKVKLIVADGPFVVAHREHGNITADKGTYLACTQLDSRTMTRVLD